MNNTQELYYSSLYEAAVAINSSHSNKEICHNLVERVARTLKAKGGSLMLLSPDRKHLVPVVVYGLSDRYYGKGCVSADRSISECLKGNITAAYNASEDERIQYREQARNEGIASILSVPVKLRDTIMGIISIYTAEPRHFTEEEIYFISAIANLSAISLENARLYKTTQQDNEMLKHDLAEISSLLNS
jgi:GAF domain-containing protein